MTNHGCRFTWCTNEMGSHKNHLLEHFAYLDQIPATGNCLTGRATNHLPEIIVGTRFNEDIEPSPTVSLNISGGRPDAEVEVDLRPDEAVLLYNALGVAIRDAIEGTNFDPKRVTSFYSRES